MGMQNDQVDTTQGNDATLSEEAKAAQVDLTIDPSVQEAADALYNTEKVGDNNNNTQEAELETPAVSTETDQASESDDSKNSENESTGDEQGSDEKPEDRENEQVEYKLEVGEDSELDETFISDIKDYAKENNLSNEAAQELVDWQNDLLKQVVEKSEQDQEKQIESWREEVLKDPELGGENLPQVSEYAKNVVKKYGNEQLINMLNESGLGNHIEVVRFLSSIGRAMANDSFESGQAKPREKEDWELFYGNNN